MICALPFKIKKYSWLMAELLNDDRIDRIKTLNKSGLINGNTS